MKCKFVKTCEFYDNEGRTCQKDGGIYYSGERPAGCWIKNEEKRLEIVKKHKDERRSR